MSRHSVVKNVKTKSIIIIYIFGTDLSLLAPSQASVLSFFHLTVPTCF
jgi:hypothetical protein